MRLTCYSTPVALCANRRANRLEATSRRACCQGRCGQSGDTSLISAATQHPSGVVSSLRPSASTVKGETAPEVVDQLCACGYGRERPPCRSDPRGTPQRAFPTTGDAATPTQLSDHRRELCQERQSADVGLLTRVFRGHITDFHGASAPNRCRGQPTPQGKRCQGKDGAVLPPVQRFIRSVSSPSVGVPASDQPSASRGDAGAPPPGAQCRQGP